MARHRGLCSLLVLLTAIIASAACNTGPSVAGTFDRDYSVTGPLRLEITNASGDVDIAGSADGKVHVRGEVRASGFGFDNPQKRLDDSIAYSIQVPRDTEVNATVASGAQTIRGVRGPVKVQAASGSIRAEKIERFAQLTTASGSISASDLGNDLRVFSASGSVTVSKVRGDVEVNAISGVIRISNPGGRVEADTASGNVDIQGAAHDVKAHAASGRVSVQGHPGGENYWELKTASGSVQLSVPASANLHLSAEAVSGEIRSDIPIVVEEQGKHSLRAHMGSGGGRVDIHTVSGEIRITGTK